MSVSANTPWLFLRIKQIVKKVVTKATDAPGAGAVGQNVYVPNFFARPLAQAITTHIKTLKYSHIGLGHCSVITPTGPGVGVCAVTKIVNITIL